MCVTYKLLYLSYMLRVSVEHTSRETESLKSLIVLGYHVSITRKEERQSQF